jgi:hypothetical protein
MSNVRTKSCNAIIAQGRLDKANQFISAADTIRESANDDEDIADAYVTLCVHAGIAASDVICCKRLGKYALGDNHNEATALLATADKEAAKHLGTLLRLKAKASYSHSPGTRDECKKAGRAAEALVEKARRT